MLSQKVNKNYKIFYKTADLVLNSMLHHKEVVMAEINTNQVSSLKSTLYSMVNNAGYAYKGNAVQSSNIKAANSNVQFAEPKQADLIHTAKEINKKMEHIGVDINFSYNDDIGGLIVTVKDPSNGGRVIREIPSKEAVELAKKMHEVVGLIFDKKG